MRLTLKLTLFVGLSLAIAGCANDPARITDKQKAQKAPVVQLDTDQTSDLLSEVEQSWLKNRNIVERNAGLIDIATQYVASRKCAEANIIVASIWPSLSDPLHIQTGQLIKAECALYMMAEKPSSLPAITAWLGAVNKNDLLPPKTVTLSYLAALNGEYLRAIKLLLEFPNASNILTEHRARDLWQWYTQLKEAERLTAAQELPELQAYTKLYKLIENVELTDLGRQQAILNWREQHVDHALNLDFPASISAFLEQEFSAISRVAILLPLSGRLAAQGDAIKQGIMTAYMQRLANININNPATELPSLVFTDTGSDLNKLSEEASDPTIYAQSDLIIGPLLKDHIQAVKALNVMNIPSIFLNRVDDAPILKAGDIDTELKEQAPLLNNRHTNLYFSLSPEDEASQIARVMLDKGITTPVVISNDSANAKRMLAAFEETWEQYNTLLNGSNANSYPVISFTNNVSMRIGITSALDVLQSQKRIAQLNNLSTEIVHSVTRNRRDIDAFVVFARPDELELLNPIIEASISLFSELQLPVFATSYSYQHQLNKNSIRDLRNIEFVDMPWLMPTQRTNDLAQQVDAIWNKPASSYLRLFAFGYDSLQFAENFQQLSYFPQNRLRGLSGSLSVNAKQQIIRELPLAKVKEDEIIVEQLN